MSLGEKAPSFGEHEERFSFQQALNSIAADTLHRSGIICRRIGSHFSFLLIGIPSAIGSPIDTLSFENSAALNASTAADNSTNPAEDVKHLTGAFDWKHWNQRADGIRHHVDRTQCTVKLNAVLSAIGPVDQASTNASSGALTLLPTAGALIGAPTTELWLLYKLVPIAGVLSMMLSLGGNIVPTEASSYKKKLQEEEVPRFSYMGLVRTRSNEAKIEEPEKAVDQDESDSQGFANMVERRANDLRGGQRFMRVWIGIALQLFWIAVVMVACWFIGSGSILFWWCKGWGWMWLWYLTVAASSILENIAGVPFTDQWTLRVSRAPRVRISEDAPFVRQSRPTTVFRPAEDNLSDVPLDKSGITSTVQVFEEVPLVRRTTSGGPTEILDALKAGFNCKGQVARDSNEPWSSSRVPFYVIISLEGSSGPHAALRVFSKAFAIGVFVTGTAIFASAQLIALSMAVAVLCLVLGAGVFGRVIGLWMVSEMMKTKPILYRVVKSREDAAEYIDRILNIDGLVVDVMGHVFVNGRCIQRHNQIFSLASWLGLLAGPFDIGKLTG